jgi:hypothetical protein
LPAVEETLRAGFGVALGIHPERQPSGAVSFPMESKPHRISQVPPIVVDLDVDGINLRAGEMEDAAITLGMEACPAPLLQARE